jgi:hypothetical protein
MPSPSRILSLAFMLSLLVVPALASWPTDPLAGVPLCVAPGEKYDVFAVSDGCGGAIVAWEDERGGAFDIYVQRLDVFGRPLWQVDGVPVCTAAGNQGLYHSSTGTTGFTPLVADGEGGAWIVWQDERAFASRQRDIYLQRVDADGRLLLPANGLAVAARSGMEDQPTMCRDGAGGVFVVWQDKTVDPIFYDLHGQRVGPAGELLWNGGQPQPLVVMDWDQDGPTVCPDGSGGFYLAWSDGRDDVGDVYAQRVDADGQPRWTAGGRAVATGDDGQDAIVIALGSDGRPLLAWVDRRSGTPDIYAQKLSPDDGASLWTAGGRAVCTAPESQYRPTLGDDGAGGAYIAWFDYRNASGPPWNLDIYAQRVLAAGTVAWTANGVLVCGAGGPQRDVHLVAAPAGGAYLAWEDDRGLTGREDIYAQRLQPDGTLAWTAGGVPVCTAGGNQNRPQLVVGAAGVIALWPDDRDVLYENDVYGGRVLDQASAAGIDRVRLAFGDEAGTATVHVGNIGSEPLTITAVTVSDPAGPFRAEAAAALPLDLAAGDLLDIVVTFDPARTPATATLEVVHTAAWPGGPLTVALDGEVTLTAIGEAPPRSALALAAAPNPFNPQTVLTFALAAPGQVTLRAYDLAGRAVRTLIHGGELAAGPHAIRWDGRDDRGRHLPSGTYLLRLRTPDDHVAARATLVR